MSKKEDEDMDIDFAEDLRELLKKFMETVGIDKEMMERIERTTKAQHEVGKIIMDLEPNESAQVVIGSLVSVVVSYSDSLDEAVETLAKMHITALNMIQMVDKDKEASWNKEKDPDDFPVEHKTKQ